MPKVFLDSEGLEKYSTEDAIAKLLRYRQEPFEFVRTNVIVNNAEISKVQPIDKFEPTRAYEGIYNSLKFRPKNAGQEQFFSALMKYAIHRNTNPFYEHDAIYVTENPIYFEKFISLDKSHTCLRDYFSNLILVNTTDAINIMGIYARRHGYFDFGDGFEKDPELQFAWYLSKLVSTCPKFASLYEEIPPEYEKKFILSLLFRYLKILYCLDYLGYEHYFGTLKKNPLDASNMKEGIELYKKNDPNAIPKMSGLISPNSHHNMFYHAEYFPSLVTGIFDNLALIVKQLYDIRMDAIRISLHKDAGKLFLKELSKKNQFLHKHIKQNYNLINLIYEFREKVVHLEGLERREITLAVNWSSFFKIDDVIHNYIKGLGDNTSKYKDITKWGVFTKDFGKYLDPYFFSFEYLNKLVGFSETFVTLLSADFEKGISYQESPRRLGWLRKLFAKIFHRT